MQNRAATISKYKMINGDDHTNENRKEHGHMVIYFKNALLDLTIHRPKIDTIYLYAKDPYEEKYQFLIASVTK